MNKAIWQKQTTKIDKIGERNQPCIYMNIIFTSVWGGILSFPDRMKFAYFLCGQMFKFCFKTKLFGQKKKNEIDKIRFKKSTCMYILMLFSQMFVG